MSKKAHFDLDDDEKNLEFANLPKIQPIQRPQKRSKKPVSQPENKPEVKQSYEGSADVQRWLQLQAFTTDVISKPRFQPTFLAGQRDAAWILSSLSLFYEEDLITDVLHMAKSGKEANVYCCQAHPSTGLEYVAAKVYRPRMFRSLKNDAIYRQHRTQRGVDGQVIRGTNKHQLNAFKSERGRAMQVETWISYEYETQQLLANAGASIPRALAHMGNAILMEYIGDPGNPAPRLSELQLGPEEVQPLFETILSNIELFLAHGRIHGDLSEYNILYWQGEIKIIDFAQAVDIDQIEQVYPLFLRDIERVCQYFARSGVKTDPMALAREIWQRQQPDYSALV